MRAVVLSSYGGPEVLEIKEIPEPTPGPEEVKVKVEATALNRADVLQRMGLYAGPKTEHEVPGLEFAGTVVEVGDRVLGVAVGDEVMGIVAGGAYAEYLVTHHRQVMPTPASLSLADAAGVPEVFMTAWDALVVQGGLTSGRTALVHAGASGVGTAAIQIAKAIGAKIYVTASTGKVVACQELGADAVIDYKTESFKNRVKELTAKAGVDVVLDVIGGPYINDNISCLKPQGRIIQVGLMGGGSAEVNLGAVLMKRAQIHGTVLRARPIEEKIALTQRFKAEMLPRFDDGSLRPIIDSRHALEDVADAHRHMESNANIGKIMLDI